MTLPLWIYWILTRRLSCVNSTATPASTLPTVKEINILCVRCRKGGLNRVVGNVYDLVKLWGYDDTFRDKDKLISVLAPLNWTSLRAIIHACIKLLGSTSITTTICTVFIVYMFNMTCGIADPRSLCFVWVSFYRPLFPFRLCLLRLQSLNLSNNFVGLLLHLWPLRT